MSDTNLRLALQRIWDGEQDLESHLQAMAQRQGAEPEVHHVALALARWSARNAHQTSDLAHTDRITLEQTSKQDGGPRRPNGPWADLHPPGLRLLEDLCQTYLLGSANSLAWEMLAQLAQATQQAGALELVSRCHPQTLRQVRWANTMIKTIAPQALAMN